MKYFYLKMLNDIHDNDNHDNTHREKLKKILDFVVDRNENVVPLHREIKEKKLLPLRGKIATLKGYKKRSKFCNRRMKNNFWRLKCKKQYLTY